MKKFISGILLAALLVSMLCMTGCKKESGDTLEEIKARGYIVIATEGEWAPWTYHDPDTNELVGFDVEIGQYIANYLGVEAQFKETTWDSILAGVSSGQFDIACNGVGYTEERAQSYRFSDPYGYTKTVLIVSSDNTEITCFEDLAGKTTANTASSTYAAVAEGYGATVTPVDDLNQTIELVTQGRIDATLNADVSYYDYMAAHPEASIKVVDSQSDGEVVVIPTALNDNTVTLTEAINACLQEMRENGTLAELSMKYFGGDITSAE